MAKSNAGTGRKIAVYYVIGNPDTKPAEADYKRLGMIRGKTRGVNWNTIDITGDTSPDNTTESLVTTKEKTVSFDGISRGDDIQNQGALLDHVETPSQDTDGQPYAWIKIVNPIINRVLEGCYLLSSLTEEYPYDDVCTWSIEGTSAGDITRTVITPVNTRKS
ncbi:phage tail tube protein [Gilliamella apicola]|uniref:Phage tail protein n=1 Tax=Gilliamella apicola TaxID=1196095 RepID=A0A2V4DZH8_9GAMM|nr:hypothetical protein [Gilliamella apicola]PXZ04341.1 hypothetical protein DKK79_08255 [Gilliamella apicola]